MKKTAILLIILMLISIGILSGCASTKLKECSVCGGSGKCNRCDGTGWAVDWDLECDNCKGTGNCPVCKGSGQIPESTPGFEGTQLLLAIIIVIGLIGLLLFIKKQKK